MKVMEDATMKPGLCKLNLRADTGMQRMCPQGTFDSLVGILRPHALPLSTKLATYAESQ
jgi:hypothetical protein